MRSALLLVTLLVLSTLLLSSAPAQGRAGETVYLAAGQSNWTTGVPEALATRLSTSDHPVRVVSVAVSGSRISDWRRGVLPPVGEMPYYARLVDAARVHGPVTAVLWWQGESEAIYGLPDWYYERQLRELAADVAVDLGVPLIVAAIGPAATTAPAALEQIRRAQRAAWTATPNVRRGPTFADIPPSQLADGLHFRTAAEVALATDRWAAVLGTTYRVLVPSVVRDG